MTPPSCFLSNPVVSALEVILLVRALEREEDGQGCHASFHIVDAPALERVLLWLLQQIHSVDKPSTGDDQWALDQVIVLADLDTNSAIALGHNLVDGGAHHHLATCSLNNRDHGVGKLGGAADGIRAAVEKVVLLVKG